MRLACERVKNLKLRHPLCVRMQNEDTGSKKGKGKGHLWVLQHCYLEAYFMVFPSCIRIRSLVDGRMCLILSIKHIHKTACTSLPEDEHLDFRNTSKT